MDWVACIILISFYGYILIHYLLYCMINVLHRMLDICNKFAIDNFIIFNSKKTICIKYGEDVRVSEQVFMNGRLLSWHIEVRHTFR